VEHDLARSDLYIRKKTDPTKTHHPLGKHLKDKICLLSLKGEKSVGRREGKKKKKKKK
jgi:hypothetical protein